MESEKASIDESEKASIDGVVNSVTIFTVSVRVPDYAVDSVRRTLTVSALSVGGNLTEKTHEWLDDGGQRISHKNVTWRGALVVEKGETVGP